MFRNLLVVLAISLATAAGATTYVDRYSGFLVLGDSLSDPGNFYALSGGTLPPSPPYFDGRSSSGPVWAEYLAADFAAEGKSTVNVAYAFARALPNADLAPDLPQQLVLASTQLGSLGSRPLAALWFGANDLFDGIGDGDYIARAQAAAQTTVVGALALAAQGVDDFLIFNLPDLSLTPAFNLFQPSVATAAAAASATFNATLATGIAQLQSLGLNVTTIDIADVFTDILADPAQFGLSNVTLPCVFRTPELAAAFGQPQVCDAATAAERLFFDEVHPNGVAHEAIAGIVRAQLAPIPLPATLPLLLVGLGGLGAVGIRRRAA